MTATMEGPLRDFILGLYDGPHATPSESDEGPIFLGIKNVTEDGWIDLSSVRHVSEKEFPKWTRRVTPKPGDVVFSYEATLHRYALIPEGFRGCLGRRMALVRVDPEEVDPNFLLYYFLSPAWRSVVESSVISGATVDRIPLTKVPDFPVSFPSVETQKRIAAILSAYDDLIEVNQRRIARLEEAARLLYREWFVRLRFPGHEHVPVVDGLPEGWSRRTIAEVIDLNPSESKPKGSILYVPMAALSESGMELEMSKTEMRDKSSGPRFRNGDTLLARITPCLENGKTGYVNILDQGEIACGSTEFIVMRGESVGAGFTYCLAREEGVRQHAIVSMVGSSGRQRVSEKAFGQYTILIGTDELLNRFERTVQPCFEQISVLSRQNAKLREARDLLLPRLMRGELVA